MKSMPTVENAATRFNAETVAHRLDVVDRQASSIVDLFPFADVQVDPNCEFGRRITEVVVEYGPADVTVSPVASFAWRVTATRSYSESEADWLL